MVEERPDDLPAIAGPRVGMDNGPGVGDARGKGHAHDGCVVAGIDPQVSIVGVDIVVGPGKGKADQRLQNRARTFDLGRCVVVAQDLLIVPRVPSSPAVGAPLGHAPTVASAGLPKTNRVIHRPQVGGFGEVKLLQVVGGSARFGAVERIDDLVCVGEVLPLRCIDGGAGAGIISIGVGFLAIWLSRKSDDKMTAIANLDFFQI